MTDQAKKAAAAVAAATPKRGSIELFSPSYFAACTLGGIIGKGLNTIVARSSKLISHVACGPTHTLVTPLDLVCFPKNIMLSVHVLFVYREGCC
jgi:hypothetical protein